MVIELMRRALVGAALIALAGCGGGGGGSSPAVPAPVKPALAQKTVTINVPGYNKAKSLRSQYVSRNTQGIGISYGASPFAFPPNAMPTAMFDVSLGSTHCTVTNTSTGARTCQLSIGAPVGTDDFQITAWSLPPNATTGFSAATELSTVSALTQTVSPGVNTPLNVALNGIVNSVNTSVSPSSIAAFAAGGTPVTATVSVNALDAMGNIIMDNGSNWIDSSGNVLTINVLPCATSNGGPMRTTPTAATAVTPASPTFTVTYAGGSTWGTSFPLTISGTTQTIPLGTPATLSVTPRIDFFPVPTASAAPWRIVSATDNHLYFTESGADKIGQIATSGAITEMNDVAPPPSGGTPMAPNGITQASDGNIWWVMTNPGSGAEVEYIPPSQFGNTAALGGFTSLNPKGQPQDLVDGGDGLLYVSEPGTADLRGVVLPSATASPSPVPNTYTGVNTPAAVVKVPNSSSPAGKVWFADSGANAIRPFDTTTHALGTATNVGSGYPQYLTLGSDGNLWYTASKGDYVGYVTTAGVASASTYATPIALGQINGITPGTDGALWFAGRGPSNPGNGGIGRVSLSGVVTSYFIGLGAADDPFGMAEGPDGNIWFTEPAANKIGRLIY